MLPKKEYIIDTKASQNYIIVFKEDKEFFRVSKANNSVDNVIRIIGNLSVKEVIK